MTGLSNCGTRPNLMTRRIGRTEACSAWDGTAPGKTASAGTTASGPAAYAPPTSQRLSSGGGAVAVRSSTRRRTEQALIPLALADLPRVWDPRA
jgi:hypothetical protein